MRKRKTALNSTMKQRVVLLISSLIVGANLNSCAVKSQGSHATQSITTSINRESSVQPSCRVFVLNRHNPFSDVRGASGSRHIGVDFAACSDRRILAVGEGIVAFVHKDTSSDPPFYTGDSVLVSHFIKGGAGPVMIFEYVHITNIRVHDGQRVRRGDTLGNAWSPSNEIGWKPHVHLLIHERTIPMEKRDPLRYLRTCPSESLPGELAFPIPC